MPPLISARGRTLPMVVPGVTLAIVYGRVFAYLQPIVAPTDKLQPMFVQRQALEFGKRQPASSHDSWSTLTRC